MSEERIHVRPADGGATTSRTVVEGRPISPTGADAVHVREVQESRTQAVPESGLGRDRVRWGPIVAGLLTALTSLLLLSLLGLAVGLTTVNAGTAAAQGGPPPGLGTNSLIWGAISAILAFLLGGFVASRTAALFDRNWGALNGALVFMLAVPLLLWLASTGLGAVLGSLGNLGALRPDLAGSAADQARAAAQSATPVDVARTAEAARNTAWGTLLGSLLGLGASALGGWLGTRRPMATSAHVTRRVVD